MNLSIASILRALALVAALALGTHAHAGVVVVAAGSDAAEMDVDAVRRVFLGRESNLGGSQAVVVYQRGGALRERFDTQVLGRSGADLTSYWSRLVFTGRARAPEELADDAAVRARVASTPGAIGYIAAGSVDDSVKVVHRF
ncbi:MAG: phosphate ABC transporter substrate-binding protein [Lysobacteraceae bacterium]